MNSDPQSHDLMKLRQDILLVRIALMTCNAVAISRFSNETGMLYSYETPNMNISIIPRPHRNEAGQCE